MKQIFLKVLLFQIFVISVSAIIIGKEMNFEGLLGFGIISTIFTPIIGYGLIKQQNKPKNITPTIPIILHDSVYVPPIPKEKEPEKFLDIGCLWGPLLLAGLISKAPSPLQEIGYSICIIVFIGIIYGLITKKDISDEFVDKTATVSFNVLKWVIGILLIIGLISFLVGLSALSITNFILVFILIAIINKR